MGHSRNSAPTPCLPLFPYPTCSLHPSPQKLFVVPADEAQAQIPYARVNHNKYMVTERASYIGEWPVLSGNHGGC